MSRFASHRFVVALGLFTALLAGVMIASQRSSSAMATAASRFLAGLTPEQRQQASFAFGSDERFQWHFIPTEMFPRKGLTIKEMTEPQRKLAHDLLKAGLSQRGYVTATAILNLEIILKALEKDGRLVRDPERYFFSMFGAPSARGPWGWRVDGHHVSLNFTIVDGTAVASSPTFFGTNPAEVREGPQKGLRILGTEEDAARALLQALDASQRAAAVFDNVAPNDIVTRNAVKVDPLAPVGIKGAALTPGQRDLLMKLIEVYTGMMADDIASDRMARLRKAGIDGIGFAWAGETERGKKHYYRIQGPTFLVEYDNTQDDGNHIHSVWRDFAGDYGRDLLREHVNASLH